MCSWLQRRNNMRLWMYRNLVLFAKNSWISDIQPHRISGIRLFKLVGYLAGQIACKSVTGDPLPILQSKIKLKSTKNLLGIKFCVWPKPGMKSFYNLDLKIWVNQTLRIHNTWIRQPGCRSVLLFCGSGSKKSWIVLIYPVLWIQIRMDPAKYESADK